MKSERLSDKLLILFLASRPKFLTASAAPILVGSTLGFAISGTFDWPLFLLALFAIMFLHAGANIANDYFDHLSRNDWINKNPTPFSGGSRFIQQGLLSPKATLLTSLLCLTIATFLGFIILLITQSVFILVLGLVGLLGGFFYTAPPIKLGYRGIGEIVIALLFGIFPVYGSYFLQTGSVDIIPLASAYIIAVWIFLVILINEFPDLETDSTVNKKNLIVLFGVRPGSWIYKSAITSTFVVAVASAFISRIMLLPMLLYLLFGLPLALAAFRFANPKDLSAPGKTQHRACAITILLHLVTGLTLSAGFIIWAFLHS